MKKNKKLLLSIASFGCAMACMVGGTYAWYVVTNTATATIHGQTAAASEGLDVGIVKTSDNSVTTWASTKTGYALNINESNSPATLYPVTSKAYTDDSAITLYESPSNDAVNNATIATSGFTTFTLRFKTKAAADVYLNIPTTKFVDTSTNNSVLHTLRVGIESTTHKSILAPHPNNANTITTNVGGVMDLNGDGVYDYEFDGTKYVETYYGEYTGSNVTYDTIAAADNTASNATTAVPVANSNQNFLSGKHLGFASDSYKKDVDIVDTAATVAKTQTAHGLYYYAYQAGGTNHPIAKTADADDDGVFIADVKFTVWMEGWDTSCQQQLVADGKTFNYTLGFAAPELISGDGQAF